MACIKGVNRSALVALAPDAPYLAAGTMAGTVDLFFNSNANLEIFKLDFQSDDPELPLVAKYPSSDRFNRLSWGRNGYSSEVFSLGLVAGGLVDGNIDIWNPLTLIRSEEKDSSLVGRLVRHKGPVRGLEFNTIAPNLLASGAEDGDICIWDLANASEPTHFFPSMGSASASQGEVSFLSWNSTLQHILASTSYNGTTMIWDLKKQKPVISFADSVRRRCSALQWNPDVTTQLVVASDEDGSPSIRLWDMRNIMIPIKEFVGHTRGVIAMSWCPNDSSYLLTCGKDSRTICWDTISGEIAYELPAGTNWNFDVHCYSMMPGVISASSFDGKIGIYNIKGCCGSGETDFSADFAQGLKICRANPASWDKKIGTALSRNMLPKQQANPHVEVDVPSIKQETNLHSSLVKADIPINTKATVLTNSPGTRTTHTREKTLPIQNSNYKRFFETLIVSNLSQLFSLPHNLQSLTIEGCESLDVLPNDLFHGLNFLTSLKLIDCSSLIFLPYPASLTNLYIRNCRKFELFPSLEKSRHKLSSIHSLSIRNSCDSLTTLSLGFFPKLEYLKIDSCPNFLSFNVTGTYTGDLALKSLEIINCLGFNSFPDEGFHTPNLNTITLSNCQNLYKFPNFIKSLTSSVSLYVVRCSHIDSFSNGGLPSSLIFLSIRDCDKLASQKDWGLENLECLTTFCINGGCIGIDSFPKENLLPKTIISLCIANLKSLRKLDDKGFQQLNGLLKLEIYSCDVLQQLPKQGLPSTLSCFYIGDCPMLTPKLESGTGEYWHMVARIPRIIIDNKIVSESSYRCR